MIHADSVRAWEAETEYHREIIRKCHAEIERLSAAMSRSDGVLFAIIFALNSAGIKDYEGNPITEINVLQGVRRLIEHNAD